VGSNVEWWKEEVRFPSLHDLQPASSGRVEESVEPPNEAS